MCTVFELVCMVKILSYCKKAHAFHDRQISRYLEALTLRLMYILDNQVYAKSVSSENVYITVLLIEKKNATTYNNKNNNDNCHECSIHWNKLQSMLNVHWIYLIPYSFIIWWVLIDFKRNWLLFVFRNFLKFSKGIPWMADPKACKKNLELISSRNHKIKHHNEVIPHLSISIIFANVKCE